ncbi:hypothetical protein [Coleofasciculus sp. FACHB-129]|uniref:hypothetical protein n=1 Tax=Coleofasciculus sp. FACHB-129 TaxID=2692785 RepID=UPI001686CE0B|nr:hypothetical protein [Coleofasciculus sp. FACHB-129]
MVSTCCQHPNPALGLSPQYGSVKIIVCWVEKRNPTNANFGIFRPNQTVFSVSLGLVA